jgi:hypothetical protein
MRLYTLTINFIMMLVLITIASSCSEKKIDNIEIVTLEDRLLSNSNLLKTDSIWYPIDSIYAKKFYVYADTILIMENNKAAGNFLNIYNMHNHQLIAKLLPFGEGPGELLYAQMHYDGSFMRVVDYIKRTLYNINIEKILNDNSYIPELIPLSQNYIITTSPVSYGDSIIYVNPFHYVNRQANIVQQPPRLIASSSKNIEPKMPMDFDYMTFNVGQGYLGANTHLGSIFFASNENSTIEFYSSDLKPIKKVVGPVSLPEARLSISGEDGKREVVYKGMLQPEAYRGFTSSADYLFFLYTGKEVPLDNQKDFKSYILCFDWKGNFQKSYSPSSRIYALSVSATSETFYATIMSEDGNPKLVKLTHIENN